MSNLNKGGLKWTYAIILSQVFLVGHDLDFRERGDSTRAQAQAFVDGRL